MRNSILKSIVAALLTASLTTSIAAAQPTGSRHPVLKHNLDATQRPKWEAAAQVLLQRSDDDLAALVPAQTPFITCDCPGCGAHTYTRGPDRVLWQFEFPDRITCRTCKTSLPSKQFAESQQVAFLNPLGESISVPCYVDQSGKRFFISSTIDSWRNDAVVQGITAFAHLYAVTKNEDYARRTAVLLAAYADRFPHYLVKDFLTTIDEAPGPRGAQRSRYEFVSTGGPWKVNGRPRGSQPSEPAASTQATSTPFGWTQSRWGWGRWASEIPMTLLRAYDLVYSSPAFAELSAARGRDVRKEIEDDLFRDAAEFVLRYPFYYHIHNNAGSQVAEVVYTGMVLGEPRYVAHGERWAESVLEQYAFSRDGAFGESPGYFYVFFETNGGNFQAVKDAASLAGNDPAAKAAIARADKAIAFLDKSIAAIESTRFPNGSALPISDNRHDDFADPTVRVGGERRAPLLESKSVLLPGYGHAVLGAGTNDRQIQAHLHFSPFKEAIHTHRDGLSLMLFAFGAELLTDLGYNRSKYRPWASTTLSHNTVVVDRKPQDGAATKGRLLAYAVDPRGLSFIQVEDAHAYGPPVTRYRRSLLLNAVDPEAPYLVDVFEVEGGSLHDYALHGPTVFESTASTDVPLQPLAGERPLLTAEESGAAYDFALHHYGQFTNVRSAAMPESFAANFQLVNPYTLPEMVKNSRYPTGTSFHYAVDPAAYAGRGTIGVSSTFLRHEAAPTGTWQTILAETPSLLRGGLTGSPLTEKLKRPSLLVRHQGDGPLTSVFVAVHQPYYQKPRYQIRGLTSTNDRVSLEIRNATRPERVDTVQLSLGDDLPKQVRVEERRGENLVTRWTVGESQIRGEISAIASRWNGDAENSFATDVELPEGTALRGRWLIVHHGDTADEGYEIERVERRDGTTVIHLRDDPGLRVVDGALEEIFLPRRRWTGPSRFTIYSQSTERSAVQP